MSKILRKVVVIGLGSISRKHISALKEIDAKVEIYALRSSKEAKEVEGVQSFYELVDISQIDPSFIIICNPTILHEETIERLTQFKIPLFIEKPSLHRLEHSEKLLEAIKLYDIKTYVACNLRYLGCLNFVKNSLSSGDVRINEVNVYAGSYLPDWRPGVDFRKSYSASREMGGGVHLDLIHELDYLYWFFGKPIKINRLMRQVSSLEIDAIDYANYTLMYPSFTANVILNYYRKEYKRTLELVLDEDVWLIDLQNNTVFSSVNQEYIYKSTDNILSTYKAQMEKFIEYIDEDKPGLNSFAESVEVLKIALNDV